MQIRGATNAVRKLKECWHDAMEGEGLESELRVVTHSSGNHAQALAYAAKRCGVCAEIVMPSTSPAVKVRAVEEYGGRVTLCHPSEQVTRSCDMDMNITVSTKHSFCNFILLQRL